MYSAGANSTGNAKRFGKSETDLSYLLDLSYNTVPVKSQDVTEHSDVQVAPRLITSDFPAFCITTVTNCVYV